MANIFPANLVLASDKFADFDLVAAQLARYSHDFSADIASKGTGVTVWYQTVTTASQWNPTNKFANTDETIISTNFTTQEPIYNNFYLSPNEQNSFGEDFLIKRAQGAAIGVLKTIKESVQTYLNVSTVPIALTVSASAMNFNTILSGSNVLVNSGSQGPITVLASTTAYSALISDASNAKYSIATAVDAGQNSFTYNLLPNVKIVQEPSVTNTFMTTPDAVAVGLRQTPQLNGYQRSTIVNDLGIVMPIDIVEDPVGGVVIGRPSLSYGACAGRQGAAVRYVHP